jgi:hypothetical protein
MIGEGITKQSKASRQSDARVKMAKVEKRLHKERKDAKTRVEEIDQLLEKASKDEKDVPELEEEKRSLENSLAMYEVNDE